jgi:hypothetical protein
MAYSFFQMSNLKKSYHNLVLRNTKPNRIEAVIDLTRQDVFLLVPDKHEISTIRFSLDLRLPLFIPFVPNFPTTDMSITFGFGGVLYQRFVQCTAQEAAEGYFAKGPFLEELNAAATAAYALVPGGKATLGPPYFWWNPVTQLVCMFVDVNWVEGVPNTVDIYFNEQLQSILNLPFNNFTPPPTANGTEFHIRVQNDAKVVPPVAARFGYPLGVATLGGGSGLLEVDQEYVQPNNWIGLDRLIFTSGSIPIVPEYIQDSKTASDATQNASLSILTDFSIAGLQQNDLFVEYLPTAEFRRISMYGSNPMQRLDLRVFYTLYDGTRLPVMLPPGGAFTAKIYFEPIKY